MSDTSLVMTQEQYDTFAERIACGKVVFWNGRSAINLEQLHFAMDAAPSRSVLSEQSQEGADLSREAHVSGGESVAHV